MNILVVGANGLVGRYLVKLLSEKDKDNLIIALVRDKKKLNFELSDNIIVIENDLGNMDLSLLPKNIDVIYYLAQSRRFRDFPNGAEDVLKINVVFPVILSNWAVNVGVKKFIYASSGGVYTDTSKPVKEFFYINANEKLDFYLSSKLSAEMLLRSFSNMFETFVIVRPFFIYGVGQRRDMLIPRLIYNIDNYKEIEINGEEGIKINPIYVTDAANAIANILNLEGEYIINIAGNEIISLKNLCLLIGEFLSKKPILRIVNTYKNDLVADIEFMKKKLYNPVISLKEGLLKVIQDYKKSNVY